MGKKSNVGAEDRKVGTIYFNSKDDIRLYNWVMDEAIPNGRYETFTAFMRSLIVAEWERQQLPASPPSEGRLATKLEHLSNEIKQMKEELLTKMGQQPVFLATAPTTGETVVITTAAQQHDFSQLTGEDDGW